jgi:Bacterial Ig-like domain (group 1)
VSVVVKDAAGNAVPGKLVDFSTKNGRGLLNNGQTASALTDSSGTAYVSLTPKDSSVTNADEVIAQVTVGSDVIKATRGFQLTQTSITFSSFTSDLSTASLSPYGQTTLTVAVSGAASGTPVAINLTSPCVSAGRASLSPTSATTTNGVATFIYKDSGCGTANAADLVQASITGSTAARSLNIPIASPLIGSIEFDTATPEKIYIKGSGYTEQSLVTFVVKDEGSRPLSNQSVSLELLTKTGGVKINGGDGPVVLQTNAQGQVTVRINSGTVPTPVRIKGTVTGGTAPNQVTVSTVSSGLAVGVGLPTQVNFTLAQSTINIEGYNRSGTANTYTVIASDRTGNPVPEATTVTFSTEGAGGQIEASAQVVDQPNGTNAAVAAFQSARSASSINDGRMTVLAYALGEESCKDLNGNNVCDSGEPFQDLGNLYKDVLFDGVFDAATDEFVSTDINANATCSPEATSYTELRYNVTVPSIAGTCDGAQGRAYVRRAVETVLATSEANPFWSTTAVGDGTVTSCPAVREVYDGPVKQGSNTSRYAEVNGSIVSGLPSTTQLNVVLADNNPLGRLNPMPAGSTLSVSATAGLSVKIASGSPVANTSSVTRAGIDLSFDTASAGTVTLTVTAPSGTASSFAFAVRTAAATANCSP